MKTLNYIKLLKKIALIFVLTSIVACSEEFSEVINRENSVVPTVPGVPVLNGWQQEKTQIPARKGASSSIYEGYLYIYGGVDAGMVRGDLWRYNIDEGYTEKLKGDQQIAYSGMAAFNGRLYVYGGLNTEGKAVDTLKYYDITKDTWTELNRPGSDVTGDFVIRKALYKHIMVSAASDSSPLSAVPADKVVIHIQGGFSEGSIENTHYTLTLEPDEKPHWKMENPQPISDAPYLKGHSVANTKDRIFYFGGEDNLLKKDTLHKFSPGTDEWTIIETSPYSPPARAFAGMISVDSYLYLFGGRGVSADLGDNWRFDIKTEEWISLSEGPEARYGFAYGEYQGCFLMFGGYSQDEDKYFSDIWIYHPGSDPENK